MYNKFAIRINKEGSSYGKYINIYRTKAGDIHGCPSNLWENKMKELSQLLFRAKNVKKYADISEFEKIVKKIEESKEYRIDWDRDAGEEWARFLNANYEIVLMLNVRIGIVFLRSKNVLDNIFNILKKLLIVEVEDFGTEEWCIDVEKIKKDLPEISWTVSEDAVNTQRMSLQDLYYATV